MLLKNHTNNSHDKTVSMMMISMTMMINLDSNESVKKKLRVIVLYNIAFHYTIVTCSATLASLLLREWNIIR